MPSGIKPKSVYVTKYYSMVAGEDNKVYATGYNQTGELGIGSLSNINAFKLVQLPNEVK